MLVIDRKLGYSDEMMYSYCQILASVVNKTIDVKTGRGKNVTITRVLKHSTHKDAIEKINNSVDYYKELMEKPKCKVEFRDYQNDIISRGSSLMLKHRFVYLAMEVRTGKTLTSLGIANSVGATSVLFVTKKKAISSIQDDYDLLLPSYRIVIINYESLHLVDDSFDLIILDEAHGMGAIPKPSKRAKQVKEMIMKNGYPYVILLSGTPTPESYSQMYHQVYGIRNNPFSEFKNFYRFCDKYVNVKERKINGLMIKDYKDGLESIINAMSPYTINYTQKQAGFKVDTREHIMEVEMSDTVYRIAKKLKKDLVVEGKDEVILADTPVKLMMKLHQLYSGTIKFESGASMIIDPSKAQFIYDNFCNVKIGIFYKFKEELNALMQIYGKEYLTTDLSEFDTTDKSIALQIVSGREGISLKKADALVYFNIDFSATSYWQSRDRMTTKDRLESDVYWIFAKGGIERDIYKTVIEKKDYTLNHFKKNNTNE